jgi:hypothetical protein
MIKGATQNRACKHSHSARQETPCSAESQDPLPCSQNFDNWVLH